MKKYLETRRRKKAYKNYMLERVNQARTEIEEANTNRLINDLLDSVESKRVIDPNLCKANADCTTLVPKTPTWHGKVVGPRGDRYRVEFIPGKKRSEDSVTMERLDFVDEFLKYKVLPWIKQTYKSLKGPYVFKIEKQAQ